MKLPKSFGKQKRLRTVSLGRVAGKSMSPTFRDGQIIVIGRPHTVSVGAVVVLHHNGFDKIKRINQIDPVKGVYVLGDNPNASTDSRSFGWIDFDEIIGKVIWPRKAA